LNLEWAKYGYYQSTEWIGKCFIVDGFLSKFTAAGQMINFYQILLPLKNMVLKYLSCMVVKIILFIFLGALISRNKIQLIIYLISRFLVFCINFSLNKYQKLKSIKFC
jgi:hypothetical protein